MVINIHLHLDIDDFSERPTSQGQKNKKEAMNKSNQKTGNKKEIITKHDITLNSLKNAKRLESVFFISLFLSFFYSSSNS